MKKFLLLTTHIACLIFGFALGIYALPILIAPEAPPMKMVEQTAAQAIFEGEFRKDLVGSDFFHWGEGQVSISPSAISLEGELAPGPDYKLYLAPRFVEDEAQFEAIKAQSLRVGEVKTFKNFVVKLPADTNTAAYNTVVVWCESFGEFISAAKYQ